MVPVNPELESFLLPYPHEIRRVVLKAREVILEQMPGALELVDPPSRIVAYGYGNNYADLVFALAPFKDHVNLMFSRGAALADPTGLLKGTGKKARHARLERLEDLDHPALRPLLSDAVTSHRG